MKNLIILVLVITVLISCAKSQEKNVIPLKVERNKSLVTVKIGNIVISNILLDFNYDNNTMTLYDTDKIKIDSSWTVIPLYFKDNNIPWVDASIVVENETPILLSMYIDYAAGDAIVLLEKPNMKFRLPEEIANMHIGRGLSGDIYGKTGNISKLIIGPYELNNVKAYFAPAEVRSKQDNADAILGSGSLRRFNLIFDYANKKLYLKPNTHFNDPFNKSKLRRKP